ncbi:protein kinase domain-containing protein [Streptomyces graminofaciens]|uniref:serine/threonine-protein kinase n=1 Tax=Streptomyces graminofaciens TaxID=68212 RepID=UPI0025738859|nr:serine/threonine-protein kinase [Streptomyces graminofaciens]
MPLHSDDPRSVGGYKLLDRLGTGGMGVVYRAKARSGREVAVKVVHAQYAEDAVFRARFRQEIEAVRKVSGAFTASVVDADPEAVRPWMATQYVAGRSLAQRIRDRGPLRAGELRGLALGLVEALREIHRAGVVHRDLKPANVLMAEDGPRVIDFGISRAAENHTLTETGQMFGTPPFMSPEQLTDARTAGPASDIFSLGTLLVYAHTGRGPFDADSPYMTAYRVIHGAPVLDGVPQPLRAVLERCLAKEAADRPGLDELAEALATALPEADPDDPPAPASHADSPDAGSAADPRAATRSGRRFVGRPLLAATGTVGALVLGLTAYLLGPGWAESGDTPSPVPSAASRWAAPPDGWKAWQTTVFETASSGARKALVVKDRESGGDPVCRVHEDAVYCGGQGVLPVRVDGRTGRTVWRADLAPSGTARRLYYSSVLGVRDGTVFVQQTIFSDTPTVDPVRLVALDAKTGDQLWTRDVNTADLPLHMTDALVLTPEMDGRTVTARSTRTGAERWSVALPVGHYCRFTTVGTDMYAQCFPSTRAAKAANKNSVILVVELADGSTTRRLTAPLESAVLGAHDGRVVVARLGEETGTPFGDSTYTALLLLDPDTGARTTTKLSQTYEGEATLADGNLWFTESSGRVTAVSPRTGERLWRTRTSLEKPGVPVYDRRTKTLYLVSGSGRLAALDGPKGTLLWETLPRTAPAVNGVASDPQVLLYKGALVAAVPDGTLFSLDPAHPDRKPASG